MARQRKTSDAQLRIGESRDSGFDAKPVIVRAFALSTSSTAPDAP
jgi:hypothetical protein